jgi:hydroxyacylglutathione hydrolase
MLLQRIYDEKLAQASYLVGCSATGEAVVVDPNRDVEQYLRAAERHDLRITHVTETHIHADFVSGLRELAQRTGATPYLSGEGGPDWSYAFADAGTVLLRDGTSFSVGNIRFDVMFTPGHTPEHVAFLVTDTAATEVPLGMFSGDFVFVGDVGRPDLLERAAQIAGTMETGARQLYASLQRLGDLPDHLQIWPAHGAGSACGRALGAVPFSTLGYERRVNWAFRAESEEAFVREVLRGQPEPPHYFAQMKRINKEGPRVLGGLRRPPHFPASHLDDLRYENAIMVDTRRWEDYAAGHVPGTISIPLNRAFTTWAGWLLPYDREFYLIVDTAHCPTCLDDTVRDLALIGLDRIGGYFDAGAVESWAGADRELDRIEEMNAAQVLDALATGAVHVIDVRGEAEYGAGHLPQVPNIPLGYLLDRLDEIPRDRPVVLQCQTGARSAIGAGLLRARGMDLVSNLRGGFAHWEAAGYPVVEESVTPSTP